MSNVILIMGESGSGKSTSIKTLIPKETFIINVIGKSLPFRGSANMYNPANEDLSQGNYYVTDNAGTVNKAIRRIANHRLDIKTLVIDDYQYVMGYEFMRRSSEKGYQKFAEIGANGWSIIENLKVLRDDLDCFVFTHVESDVSGFVKPKTIGKMLDNVITFEGMFTVVLKTEVVDGKYCFLTNDSNGNSATKSPIGMFDRMHVDNDLAAVKKTIRSYYEAEFSDIEK